MIQVTLLFVAKSLAVADQKLKIARVGLVYGRVVDFVDDAVAECEPCLLYTSIAALKINFARQRNVAVPCFAEFPIHLEIIH